MMEMSKWGVDYRLSVRRQRTFIAQYGVLAIWKSGGQDFDGESPRHLSMSVRPRIGRLKGRFWRSGHSTA
jgi:hypothetical protein